MLVASFGVVEHAGVVGHSGVVVHSGVVGFAWVRSSPAGVDNGRSSALVTLMF